MSRIFCCICALFLTACASVQERPPKNWVSITGSETTYGVVRYYFDPSTVDVSESSGQRTAKVITVYSQPKMFGNNQFYRSILAKKEFNCSARKSRTVSQSLFADAEASVLLKEEFSASEWQDVSRRTYTVGAAIANHICDL